MRDEGVIKFRCEWDKAPAPALSLVREMNACRTELFDRELIGVYSDGIGFGNLSVRKPDSRMFVITGTQTGPIRELEADHYTTVTDYDIEKNVIRCEGPVKASSESLTHAMIYEIDPAIQAVIHVHDAKHWKRLLDRIPTTDESVLYGTPEMAREIKRLDAESELRAKRMLVMAGHAEGIISFGASCREARDTLLKGLSL